MYFYSNKNTREQLMGLYACRMLTFIQTKVQSNNFILSTATNMSPRQFERRYATTKRKGYDMMHSRNSPCFLIYKFTKLAQDTNNNNNKSAQSNLGTGPRRGSCVRRWLA